MNKKIQCVDVCIATYKRPDLLTKLLDSLVNQCLGGIRMRIIVVDNDRAESAKPVVMHSQKNGPVECVYDVEPQQSIALVRNRALQHVSADYFAFLDDDEIVSANWLRMLLATMASCQADVVFGPVVGILPDDAPTWARECRVFRRSLHRSTGTAMKYGGTGNVLIRRNALEPTHEFNPAFGLTGGSDTDFFYRFHLAGKCLVWCDEALVYEQIPAVRMTFKWVSQRGFRSGQTFFRIFVPHYTFGKKCICFVKQGAQLFAAAILLLPARMVSYPLFIDLTIRLCQSAGQLSAFVVKSYFLEYHNIRYRTD